MTNQLALFVEAFPRDEGRPQYLIFPGPRVQVFFRVTDGGRHGSNRWQPCDDTDVEIAAPQQPTAVLISDRDHGQVLATGVPITLTVKAQKAHAKSPVRIDSPLRLDSLCELVRAQDPSLGQYLRDGRRSGWVPSDPVPAAEPAAQPAAQPEPVAAGSYSMSVVPPQATAESYVHRRVGGVEDFEVFSHAQRNALNVLLYGPTGPGKTTSAIAYAAAHSLPVFMVSGTVALEPSQLFGRYIPDGQGGFVWQDGGVTELVRHGGVLILDEVNFIPSKIATVLFPLLAQTRHITLLDHKGETIQAHKDLLIVGTMNPGYIGTQELNAAFRNRFSIQVPWGYDNDVEKHLVKSKALLELASQLRAAEAREELITPTPTNALIEFIELSGGLGLTFAVENFIARFDESEQSKVRLVLDTHRANIESDLGLTSSTEDSGLAEWERELLGDTDPLQALADLDLTTVSN